MFWEQKIQYALLSDVGFRRQNNQDACVATLASDRDSWQERGHLFVVADGMGGHAVGELASKMAVDTIPHTFDKLRNLHPLAALKSAIETANERIHERGSLNRDFLRMGTTCTALLLGPQGAIIGHVGDSRAYRIRRRQIDQLTRDHSLVWELIEQRKVHPRDADRLYPRNVITRSLGPEPKVEVDMEGPSVVMPGDTYILCSDGLTTLVGDSEIGMIASELPPQEACRLLVALANLRGGSDNITVAVIRAGEVPNGAETYDAPTAEFATEEGTAWGAFAAYCALALAAVVGFLLLELTQHRAVGFTLVGGAILGTVGTWWGLRKPVVDRESVIVNDTTSSNSTIIWRPYRTAPAKISADFLTRLGKIESELYRAAIEEHWPVNMEERSAAFQRAQNSLAAKHLGQALHHYATAIELLMVGVLWQRKQGQKESRGAKTPLPKTRKGDTPPGEVEGIEGGSAKATES